MDEGSWAENNKSAEENKYVDSHENLKKNDVIKKYVNMTWKLGKGGVNSSKKG